MMIALLIAQQSLASPFESAQLDGTAHAPRQGDFFLKPLGSSSFGLTDRLAVSSNAIGWVQDTPNISSEFNIVDDWGWALSVTPYISTDYSFDKFRSGATFIHSLQYAEDRLNTSVRVGYVGQRTEGDAAEGIATGTLEGELGVSYDIVASKEIVHRFKSSLSSGMNVDEDLIWSAGYSLHAAIGQRARLELGVDFGEPSSYSGVLFNEQYREKVYGDELSGKDWLPSPNASLFWVF
jgi:hypothetical protein